MDLVLIRHPAPAIDVGVCYGKTDVPLAGDAVQAAQAVAQRLVAPGVPVPARFVTSPLQRCAQVADRLAQRFACECTIDARLQEIDFGAWEGRRWEAIDRVALDAWAADLRGARMHGGESVEQFEARIGRWLDDWCACRTMPASTLHVVTHAGVIRMIASLALGEPLEAMLKWPLDVSAVVWLQREPDSGDWRLRHWNA